MTLDVVNGQNQKVGSLDLSDEVFGGPVKTDLIWMQVRARERLEAARHARDEDPRPGERQRQEAVEAEGHRSRPRRRDRATRCGARAARCSGRSRATTAIDLPKKMAAGALRAALTQKLRDGAVTVVDALAVETPKTKTARGRAAARALGLRGQDAGDRRAPRRDVHDVGAQPSRACDLRPVIVVTARDVMDARPRDRDAGGRRAVAGGAGDEASPTSSVGPLVTEKTTRLARERATPWCSRWRVWRRRSRCGRRSRSCFGAKVARRAHRDRARQGEAAGPVRRAAQRTGRRRRCGCRDGEKVPEFIEGA